MRMSAAKLGDAQRITDIAHHFGRERKQVLS